MKRCKWCNLKNELYVKYHDEEWCRPNLDDKYLYEMLILESFQAGLSWECVLNKRESFRKAFDKFDIDKICQYDNNKVQELLGNKEIIRNKLKINATINNSKIFKEIQKEYGSFYNYLKIFTNGKTIYETDKTTNSLSDNLSKDLQKRGMKFVGSTTIYSYLQAIGVIYSHDNECFLHKEKIKWYVPIIEKYPLTLECVVDSFEDGELIGKVANCSVDEAYLDENSNIDVDKMEIITFDMVSNTYRVLGEVVGNAFEDGLKLKD